MTIPGCIASWYVPCVLSYECLPHIHTQDTPPDSASARITSWPVGRSVWEYKTPLGVRAWPPKKEEIRCSDGFGFVRRCTLQWCCFGLCSLSAYPTWTWVPHLHMNRKRFWNRVPQGPSHKIRNAMCRRGCNGVYALPAL